ncbi:MAG: NAD(P)/FAD-dependent oxidoreductase [Acidithiobacillus sp.]
MKRYNYLIVGAGAAAASAASAIRKKDPQGSILMLGAEMEPPYQRPPLSKGLWLGKDKEEEITLKRPADWETLGVTLALGDPVIDLDAERCVVGTKAGKTFFYEKLLLATGGQPRPLPTPPGLENRVFSLRSLADYRRLHTRATEGGTVLVIGGGFLGAELAVALSSQPGLAVQYCVSGRGPLAHVLPPPLVEQVSARYREAGVQLHVEHHFKDLRSESGKLVSRFADGAEISCDWIAYGIGMLPLTALAEAAGLVMAPGGVRVDDGMRSSDPQIWIAGDLATYPDPVWGTPLRLEHWDNAEATGRAAGSSMAGKEVHFQHQSMFYSDIYEFGFEAVGECRSDMDCYTDLSPEGKRAVVYYLREGQIHGMLLWNVWEQVKAARDLIAAKGMVHPEELRGRIGDW